MEKGYYIPEILNILINDGNVCDAQNMLTANEKVTVIESWQNRQSPEIVLDFGKKVTGYIFLELEESSGDQFVFEYGPVKECMHVHKALYMPASGCFFMDEQYIACRYLKISLKSIAEQPSPFPVYAKIKRFGLVPSAYPCNKEGVFSCDNAQLNQIWSMGSYTVNLCMQKSTQTSAQIAQNLPDNMRSFIHNFKSKYGEYVIFDGPRRDRETWLGDIRTEALVCYSAFGAYDVAKASLDVFRTLQKKDGLTVGCGGTWQPFIEYNLWYVIAIWECYLYSGDKNFLDEFLPSVKALLRYIEYHEDERGFIYNDGNWMWTLPREGYSSGANTILYYMYQCVSNIFAEYECDAEVRKYRKKAEILKESINKEFWNEEKGVYDDSLALISDVSPVLLDVNCYAITFGVANESQTARILQYIKEHMWCEFGSTTTDVRIKKAVPKSNLKHYPLISIPHRYECAKEDFFPKLMYPHNKQIWPFVDAYEVEARLVAGDYENAFELIKRCWGNPAYQQTGTYWEMFDIDAKCFAPRSINEASKGDCMNSAAHGWSGWISYIMQTYILGVRPTAPGFRQCHIAPIPGNLKEVSGKVPTPYGVISVSLTIAGNRTLLTVKKPHEVQVEIGTEHLMNAEVQILEK